MSGRPIAHAAEPAIAAPPQPQTCLLLNSDARSGNFQLMFSSGSVNGTIFFTSAQADQLARQILADLDGLPERRAKVAKAMGGAT